MDNPQPATECQTHKGSLILGSAVLFYGTNRKEVVDLGQKLRIGFDLDDVCWDLLGSWLKRYNELANDNLTPKDIKSWDISKYVKHDFVETLFYILEEPGFWETVEPKEKSQDIMKKLTEEGHELYIVTATSPYVTLPRKVGRFFELYPFMKPGQMIVTQHKQLLRLDVLVDDKPENLQGGHYRKLLFSVPHNERCDEGKIGAERCNDWDGIHAAINKMAIGSKGVVR